MAAVTGAARLLRIDRGTWADFAVTGTIGSAILVTAGAYAVFAFDRFGFQGLLEPRPTVRMMLIGFYGWVWLATAATVVGRMAFAASPPLTTGLRLYGYAHLPLLLVAITIQLVSVTFNTLGPARVASVFTAMFWMPTLLIAASRQMFDVDTRRAILLIGGPYAVWLLVVGRIMTTQLGHLL